MRWMPDIVLYIPLFVNVVYLLWLLVKRPSHLDAFFEVKDYTAGSLLERAKHLEAAKGIDHRKTLLRVRNVSAAIERSKLKIGPEGMATAIEEAMREAYFDGFRSRWAGFHAMDLPLRSLIIFNYIAGVFYSWCIVYYMLYIGMPFDASQLWPATLWSLIYFPMTFGLGIFINGALYFVGLILSAIFSKKAALERVTVILQEAFSALRAGRRHEQLLDDN